MTPDNRQRGIWASDALEAYRKSRGGGYVLEEEISDLITDLLHFGREKGIDTDLLVGVAVMNFDAEA